MYITQVDKLQANNINYPGAGINKDGIAILRSSGYPPLPTTTISSPRRVRASSMQVTIAASQCFPQEIYDEIMAFLQGETSTLRSCALVCRAWLSRARHHLFRNVFLDPSSRSRHFVDLTQGCPEILSLVRDLELRGRASASKAWWEGGPSGPSSIVWPTLNPGNPTTSSMRRESDAMELLSWLRDTFAPLPTSTGTGARMTAVSQSTTQVVLPKVRTLRLSEFTPNADTISLLARAFPHVGVLSLNGCRAMSFADIMSLLQAFPQMHTLRLLSAEWLPGRPGSPAVDGATASEALLSPSLRHLELSRDIHTEPLLEWFVKMGAHRNIRSLKCSIATHQGATAMRTFLRASGPFLEFLSITLSESRDPTAILDTAHLDLVPCTALQTLQIRGSPSRTAPTQRSLSWVLILLSRVRSAHLREVRISMKAAELPSLNLEGLDVVLAQNGFDRVRDLTFEVDDSASGSASKRERQEELEGMLKARLLSATAQQLVRLEYRG